MSKSAGFFKSVAKCLSKNSPAILVGIGLAGMTVAAILAIRKTPKALKHLEEKKMEVNAKEADENPDEIVEERELTVTEAIGACWKDYVFEASLFLISGACVIFSHGKMAYRYASLGSAYRLLELEGQEVERQTIKMVGESKNEDIHHEVAKAKRREVPYEESMVYCTGKGDTLCFDPYCARYFKTSIDCVKNAYIEATERLISEDTLSLNQFYDELDLPRSKLGEEVGWSVHSMVKPVIRDRLTSDLDQYDRPYLIIGFREKPTKSYRWD